MRKAIQFEAYAIQLVRLSALSLTNTKFETMKKEELKKFWEYLIDEGVYKSKGDEYHDIVINDFLNSEPQNESPNIRQNEEQIRNCDTCKHCDVMSEKVPCPFCDEYSEWEAIPIVPTEGHSA